LYIKIKPLNPQASNDWREVKMEFLRDYRLPKGLRLEELDLSKSDDLEALARFYCEVWKEPPWLEFHWTYDAVIKYILETSQKIASIWLLIKNQANEIVAFALGYGIDFKDLEQIANRKDAAFYFGEKPMFYDAEVAVMPTYRKQGLATVLIRARIDFARFHDLKVVIARTKAPNAIRAMTKIGFFPTTFTDGSDPERVYWRFDIS